MLSEMFWVFQKTEKWVFSKKKEFYKEKCGTAKK